MKLVGLIKSFKTFNLNKHLVQITISMLVTMNVIINDSIVNS